ncbi:MAG: thymidylate kinase [Candidatus Handelsmanbacteria bacterium RIFCSPLOWO2_12_FULL_64_10]|uniref:Thymidylate kinase n=1 Tax=Handelsmanbacteria sp. (strain RIFCSPLOWO2_12_FULL_64_10) TaxID=1817868 RepID=A0A1F6CL74_HANXR|nr:MAG: thymidylate kinase [Candidatus Handelsmanbacteria bacterium RIFCSPLOWO2_12_FULL_64_10]
MKRFYGRGLPGVASKDLSGKLIVLEGADGSGRSTQAELLTAWLERKGYATVNVGLNRSTLVSRELSRAKGGNVLSQRTLSLFYATDFADQLENRIVPALKAGFVVLADRYIYTLIARDVAREGDRAWLESLYGIAIVPDIVFYLRVSPRQLVERNFQKHATLDYWESGMDLGLSRDMFQSFLKYQGLIQAEFERMQKAYGFDILNGNRSIRAIAKDLQARVEPILERSAA